MPIQQQFPHINKIQQEWKQHNKREQVYPKTRKGNINSQFQMKEAKLYAISDNKLRSTRTESGEYKITTKAKMLIETWHKKQIDKETSIDKMLQERQDLS